MRQLLLGVLCVSLAVGACLTLEAYFNKPPQTAPDHARYRDKTHVSATPASPLETLQLPDDEPPLGLDGYCPVSVMRDQIWKRGQQKYSFAHKGRTYLLADDAARAAFLADPDRFAPYMSGHDVVEHQKSGALVEGMRSFGVVYRNQMYLFSSDATRAAFERSPEPFLSKAPPDADETARRTKAANSEQPEGQALGTR